MESKIWDIVSGDRDPPNNTHKGTKLAKDKTQEVWIIKSDIFDAFFL